MPKSTSTAQASEVADITSEKDGTPIGHVEIGDEKFYIVDKPDALLLAELARTGSGDPESFGVIAEFFEYTLGKDGYRAFKKAIRAKKQTEAELMKHLESILTQCTGRPTE